MLDQDMDVDDGSKTPSMSSPAMGKWSNPQTQPQFKLPDSVNSKMVSYSIRNFWQSRVEKAGDDVSTWRELLIDIFGLLLGHLQGAGFESNFITIKAMFDLVETLQGDDLETVKALVREGVEGQKWQNITAHLTFQAKSPHFNFNYLGSSRGVNYYNWLKEAYNTPYIGDAAKEFVEYLSTCDSNVRNNQCFYYAKAVPVVQSSGTGKSRMLTEAGKLVFTLPICLRDPNDPGYPPSDEKVFYYFHNLPVDNDLSFTAHSAVARFLAACHETMLEWLKRAGRNGPALLEYWQELMEQNHDERRLFFSEVVETANSMTINVKHPPVSPRRGNDGADATNTDIEFYANQFYRERAQQATKNLMEFVAGSQGRPVLCVTYFDEADTLGLFLWILLRVLSNQMEEIAMWYVFMATKSKVDFFFARKTEE